MSKIECKCGATIRLSGDIPNQAELLVISDHDFEVLLNEKNQIDELYGKMKSAFMCGNCKRLWFFFYGMDKDPICYRLDS